MYSYGFSPRTLWAVYTSPVFFRGSTSLGSLSESAASRRFSRFIIAAVDEETYANG